MNEARKTRAQYLNGLAVMSLSFAGTAVLAGAPLWVLAPATVLSLVLHWAAVVAVKTRI